MGIDYSAAVVLGLEITEETIFDIETETVIEKSCEHPNPDGNKHCGECGKKYKTRERTYKTLTLKPEYKFLHPEESQYGLDIEEISQCWREGVIGIHTRHGDDAPRDRGVVGVSLASWDPKYEVYSEKLSFKELEEKRMQVWGLLSKLGFDSHFDDIEVFVWGDMH